MNEPVERKLSPAELDIIVAKLSAMSPDQGLDLTPQQVAEIRTHIWWRRELYSPAGLSHLFPGLGRKRGDKSVTGRRPS